MILLQSGRSQSTKLVSRVSLNLMPSPLQEAISLASGQSQAYHGANSCRDDSANKRKRSAYDPNAYCQLHEQWGHWTDDCTVVEAQLEAMKSQYQAHK
jgi:hypothetical protein